MKIVKKKLAVLKPYWRNPRHNTETVVELKKSIKEFGFNVPILIDKDNTIIAGHARYRSLLELGIETVACVVSDMSATKAKEYRIADNKIHDLTNWMVDGLVKELKSAEFAMTVPGFTQDDTESLFPSQIESPFSSVVGGGAVQTEATGNPEEPQVITEEEEDTGLVTIMCPECFEECEYNKYELLGIEKEEG